MTQIFSPASVLTHRSGQGVPTGVGSSHAKAILFGEHTVVYGAPAIAFPLPELTAEAQVRLIGTDIDIDSDLFHNGSVEHLDPVRAAAQTALLRSSQAGGAQVRIRSNIPPGRGLGSSAAVAAAVARAVANSAGIPMALDVCYDIVQEAERRAHGTPSGLDARAVISDSVIRFQRGDVSGVTVAKPLTFVLADSGMEGPTAQAVAAVRARREADPVVIDSVITRLARIADQAQIALGLGDIPGIGTRMSKAHSLLGRLGVSTPTLDMLVSAAHGAESPGAKLTGGGLGGCVLALATSPTQAQRISTAMRSAGAPRTWITTLRNA